MPDGKITFSTDLDNKELEKNLAKIKRKIEDLERDISGKKASRNEFAKQSEELSVQLDIAKAKLYEMQTAAKGVFSTDQISEQKEMVDSLQYRWDSAQRQVEKYDRQIQNATIKLNQNKSEAAEITDQLSKSEKNQNRFNEAIGDANKRFAKLQTRISMLASRVFIFSMITAGLRYLRAWMGDVIKTNDEASAALARLKGALLTMAQPLVDVVIPAFITLVNLLTAVIGKIAAFISAIGGKTVKQSADAAKALNKEANAIGGVGSAAKEARNQLAGFDEINRMESTDTSAGGGGSGASGDIQPDFDWSDSITETLDRIADLVLLIGSGLAVWKIGSMLPGTLGTIATTLGQILITVGGILLYWDGLTDALQNGVDWDNLIEMVGGLSVSAFGLYQLLGPIASGIVLVVGGLTMLVTAFNDAAKRGWNLKNTLLAIAGIIATGLGITLLTGSLIPLLIASIASLLLAMTISTGHGQDLIEGIKEACKGFVDFFSGIFSGDIEKTLSGIESIFSGLGKTIQSIFSGIQDTILWFLDWLDEKTGGKLTPIINTIKDIVNGMFDYFKTTSSGVIESFKQILSGLVKFIFGAFSGDWRKAWDGIKEMFKGAWNGTISYLENGINLIIKGLNWLIKQINKISFTVPSWVPGVGGKSIGPNLKQVGEVSLPRLAQGAVIPPNREFMAVLGDQKHGTNIEAPLSTIQEAVAIVMEDMVKSNIAGHEATVAVLQAILEAVNAIDTSDERYANAVDAYRRKVAVARGV